MMAEGRCPASWKAPAHAAQAQHAHACLPAQYLTLGQQQLTKEQSCILSWMFMACTGTGGNTSQGDSQQAD